MSDIRGIPRRSKTAVVVVLVVFLQMLALAVVGIGAIKEDRERGRQMRIRDNREEARLEVTKLRRQITGEVSIILREALTADSWARFREDRDAWAQPLVRQVFRRLNDGGSYLVGGSYLWLGSEPGIVLYQPPEIIDKHFKGYAQREKALNAVKRGVKDNVQSPRDLLADYVTALGLFPLLVQQEGTIAWPLAAGWANKLYDEGILLDAALDKIDPAKAKLVRSAVLHSLMVEGLNLGRPEFDGPSRRLVGEITPKVLATLPRLPDDLRGDLEAEVREFLEHRTFLATPATRGDLEGFVRTALKGKAELRASMPYVRRSGTHLFAMAMSHDGTLRIARMNIQALDDLVRARAEAVRFRQWGMELRVRDADTSSDAGEVARIVKEEIEDGELQVPFELALFKVADVVGEGEGQSEVWYWAIICLAALGTLFGAVILGRLWRREVRLTQLKADFVSNLSHELKTPLTSISLFTEMLRDGKFEDAPEDQAEAYAVLDQEAQRLQRIVQRMIETARNEAQGVPHDLAPGDLNRPVLGATNRFRRIVTEPGLDLSISLATEPLPMMLDASAMDDVVTNLLTNSWKYKRGDKVRIKVQTARRGRRAEITVTDDGIGIPRKERRRVFKTFVRAEQYLTQPVAGTGLGLALVRTIVRAHKGRIRVGTGEGGVGTTFRLRFPLSRKAAYAAANPSVGEENGSADVGKSAAAPRTPEGIENTGATA